MIVITGGACQGKLEYAKERFAFTEADIEYCTVENGLSFKKSCIYNLHLYILGAIRKGEDPIEIISKALSQLEDKILICDDICSGVVPIERENRLWRDNTGKIMQILCRNAVEVVRLFCGLPEKIKGE